MRENPEIILFSKKPVYWIARHLFLFVSMVLVFSWIVSARQQENNFITSLLPVLLNAVFFFGYAYLTAYILVPWLLSRRIYLAFFVLFLLAGMLISLLKFYFSDYLFYSAIASDEILSSNSGLSEILVNTKDMSFIVAIFLIAKYAKDNYYMQQNLRELQDFQIKEEIKLLKNQLDPHVIFNTLNNLYSISLNNTAELQPKLSKFYSVLEYYFIKGKKAKVYLRDELKAISDYIDLERLRYSNRLSISYKVQGNVASIMIAPFILFHFVENCFEHGSSIDSGQSWIKILVSIKTNEIQFHASNSKPAVNNKPAGSVRDYSPGISHRLNLLYPDSYLLRVDDRHNIYSVDLKLKLKHGLAAHLQA